MLLLYSEKRPVLQRDIEIHINILIIASIRAEIYLKNHYEASNINSRKIIINM